MRLLDRANQLLFLDQMLKRSRAGTGQAVLIQGAVATGKTALLHQFAGRAAEDGALVLRGTGALAERGAPLELVSQLFHSAHAPDSLRQQADTVLRGRWTTAAPEGPLSTAEPHTVRTMNVLSTAVLDRAGRQPVLLAVDDAHHADDVSLMWLLYALRRICAVPVMLALTARQHDEPRGYDFFRSEFLRYPFSHRVRLGPLSHDVTADPENGLVGPTDPHPAARRLHEISGGNPLLLRGLLDDQAAAGVPLGQRDVTPGGAYGEAVLECLHRCPPPTLDVIRAAAVLGPSGTQQRIGTLAGARTGEVTRVLDHLTAAGITAGDGRLRHPAAEAAVLDAMDPADRAYLHGQAARLLHREGTASTVVAGHLVAHNDVVAPWAVRTLTRTAELALADGHNRAARDRLDLAYRHCTQPQPRAQVKARLVEAIGRTDVAMAVPHLSELREAAEEGHLSGRGVLVPVWYLLWFGQVPQAVTALRRAAERAAERTADRTADRGADRASVLTGNQVLQFADRWTTFLFPAVGSVVGSVVGPAVGSAVGPAAPMTGEPAADPYAQACAALSALASEATVTVAVARAEQVLRRCVLDDTCLPAVIAAMMCLNEAGRFDRSASWHGGLLEQATAAEARTWQGLLHALRADSAVGSGDLATAERHARIALSLIPFDDWGALLGLPIAALVRALTGQGRHDAAAEVLARPVPRGMLKTRFGFDYLDARAGHQLATGKSLPALRDIEARDSLAAEWRVRRHVSPPARRVPGAPMMRRAWRGGPTPSASRERAAGRRGSDTLSDAERRVAELAARGHTNREVAAALRITVSTVEQHLTRVYRKLKVSQRAELPACLWPPMPESA